MSGYLAAASISPCESQGCPFLSVQAAGMALLFRTGTLQHRVHTLENDIFYSKFIGKLDIRLHWSYIN
jgi:hypothetical protein